MIGSHDYSAGLSKETVIKHVKELEDMATNKEYIIHTILPFVDHDDNNRNVKKRGDRETRDGSVGYTKKEYESLEIKYHCNKIKF